MKEFGGLGLEKSLEHHKFNPSSIQKQTNQVQTLLKQLDEVGFSMDSQIEEQMSNVVTGRVFPENCCQKIIGFEAIGRELYQQFIRDRLSEDSKIEIKAPLKKVKILVFKRCQKKRF